MTIRFPRHLALILVLLLSPVAHAVTPTEQMAINQKRYGIAAQGVLVMHDGQVVFKGIMGASEDSIFPVYSVSKLFVSTLVMQLAEQGKIDLDKPASAYLTGLPTRWQPITVRQLLNHTSGLPEYFDSKHDFLPTVQATFASLAERPLVFTPGSASRYTQTNYLVLTLLLETQYGKPYPQIASERILRPLGMKHTFLGAPTLPKSGVLKAYAGKGGKLTDAETVPWPVYSYGHSDLFLTLDDLARFLKAISRGELVGKQALQQLWQPPRLTNDRPGMFATGWEYGESGAYHHVGHDGGTQVRVRFLFKDKVDGDNFIVIYLTNGSVRNVWSRVLLDSAMAAAAPDQFPQEVLAEQLIAFALGETGAPSIDKTPLSERTVNTAGYAVLENLGPDAALRVFDLGTTLFPESARAWEGRAEVYRVKGDPIKARESREKARELAKP
ncbi:serine hydrolase [Roseateles aquatilis]|uniref:serine hydrolase n=1 Tax=Roseateles aquatilis TaxID=431061 RepID=UPI0013033F91|nr:serine hydrolase [Roseateles aquatilis]